MQEGNNNTEENNLLNEKLVHYKKLNIIGGSKVGKSSLILRMENYLNSEFKINPEEKHDEENNENNKIPTLINLTEQLKKLKLKINENRTIHLNCYETTLTENNIGHINLNLETLLTYSEFIILMIDISSLTSFNLISEIMPNIISLINSNTELSETKIIFISNKTDLESQREVSGFEIKEFLDKYPNILNIELSLIDTNNFNDFIKKFNAFLEISENENSYDVQHLIKIYDPPSLPSNMEKFNINNLALSLFFLGSATVGKTSFMKRFFKSEFITTHLSTLGMDVEKTLAKVDDKIIKIEVWDTVGQERLRSIPKRYYSKGDGFLLLFDVTNKKTYDDITGWIKDIRESRGVTNINGVNDKNKSSSNEVLFLIGNKIDDINNRVVQKEDALELAKSYGVNYYEVSCKDGVNVYEVMTKLIFESFSNAKGYNDSFNLKKEKTKSSKKRGCCVSLYA